MKVLLVEDEVELGTALARVLERRGFQVQHRATGHDALQALAQERFEVVVLDLGLPGMDGLQLLQRLRDHGNTMPVLVLTEIGRAHV